LTNGHIDLSFAFMMTIRSFIAIELSTEARTALTELQNRLKGIVPSNTVRWAAPQNVHLTLHFWGDVAVPDIEKITNALDAAAVVSQPFSLTLGGLGCFPNLRRPRIVWVGILGDTPALGELRRDLGEKLKVIDFTPETRPYSPHLTIGRVKKRIPARHLSQLGEMLEREQANVGQLADLRVTEISLIKSELKPTGPVYTQLSRSELITNC
jgi:2'-5' RNA ligase